MSRLWYEDFSFKFIEDKMTTHVGFINFGPDEVNVSIVTNDGDGNELVLGSQRLPPGGAFGKDAMFYVYPGARLMVTEVPKAGQL